MTPKAWSPNNHWMAAVRVMVGRTCGSATGVSGTGTFGRSPVKASLGGPEIERFGRWLRIADGREDFLRGIEEALQPEPPAAAQERAQAMQAHTWDARAAEVLVTVADALRSRQAQPGRPHAQRA